MHPNKVENLSGEVNAAVFKTVVRSMLPLILRRLPLEVVQEIPKLYGKNSGRFYRQLNVMPMPQSFDWRRLQFDYSLLVCSSFFNVAVFAYIKKCCGNDFSIVEKLAENPSGNPVLAILLKIKESFDKNQLTSIDWIKTITASMYENGVQTGFAFILRNFLYVPLLFVDDAERAEKAAKYYDYAMAEDCRILSSDINASDELLNGVDYEKITALLEGRAEPEDFIPGEPKDEDDSAPASESKSDVVEPQSEVQEEASAQPAEDSTAEADLVEACEEESPAGADKDEHTVDMSRYIGILVNNMGFFNFFPLILKDGRSTRVLSREERQHLFPKYGAVFVGMANSFDPYIRRLRGNTFYSACFLRDELGTNITSQGTNNEQYCYKFDDIGLLIKERRFVPIENEGIYPVVHPVLKEDEELSDCDLLSPIFVSASQSEEPDEFSFGMRAKVVLEHDGRIIGPATIHETASGAASVNLRTISRAGEIPCCSGSIRNAVHTVEFPIFQNGVPSYISRELFFSDADGIEPGFVDALTDEELIGGLIEKADEFDAPAKKEMLDWLQRGRQLTEVLGSTEEIRTKRLSRIRRISEDLQNADKKAGTFVDVLLGGMSRNKSDADFLHRVCEAVAADENALMKIKDYREVKEKIEELKKDEDSLEDDIKEKKKELDSVKKKTKARIADAEERIDGILEKLDDHLKKAVSDERMIELAFDPIFAQKFSAAAGRLASSKKDDRIAELHQSMKNVKESALCGSDLVDYLVRETSRLRSYDRNTIINFYICLAQSFLTVYAGKPGSGKTSILGIIASVLGLNSFEERIEGLKGANRFLPVSVERGWTSKQDFLGYYNPLSKKFEVQDPKRWECFVLLDKEANESSRFPYMVLLDEANLSQMEYYWSDFMNICDGFGPMSRISLGDGFSYRIPETLRFAATINNDNTTEALSPRLIDRSWVITLPEPEFSAADSLLKVEHAPSARDYQLIGWENLKKTFSPAACWPEVEKDAPKIQHILGLIYAAFRELGCSVSMRSRRAVADYIIAASRWFKSKNSSESAYAAAIDFAVVQKILPALNISGMEHEEKLEAILALFTEFNLSKSTEAMREIIERGRRSMGIYSFF